MCFSGWGFGGWLLLFFAGGVESLLIWFWSGEKKNKGLMEGLWNLFYMSGGEMDITFSMLSGGIMK